MASTAGAAPPRWEPEAALWLDGGAARGAATHITGTFAFAAVGKMLEVLLKKA